jgi:hypothetical protein
MKPLQICKIPKDKIFEKFPLPGNFLKEYLKSRPDVLENTDIFFENCRSKKETYKDFSLFEEFNYHELETIYLCPVYLELFEYAKINVLEVIEHCCALCYPNIVVFQWNHDTDFASKYLEAQKHTNAVIINFNTSKSLPNDIIIPFWVVNTAYISEKTKYFAGFIGSLNNSLRKTLVGAISGKEGYTQIQLPYKEFLKTAAQCKFSFCPRGQGLSSYRFYECMHLSTIPVLIADKSVLPYTNEIDYEKICIRVPEAKASDFDYIDNKLKEADVFQMHIEKNKVKEKFTLLGVQQEIYRRLS